MLKNVNLCIIFVGGEGFEPPEFLMYQIYSLAPVHHPSSPPIIREHFLNVVLPTELPLYMYNCSTGGRTRTYDPRVHNLNNLLSVPLLFFMLPFFLQPTLLFLVCGLGKVFSFFLVMIANLHYRHQTRTYHQYLY